MIGPGKILAGVGALGLLALFSSKSQAAALSPAPSQKPIANSSAFSKLCGIGLCLYVQEVRPGYFEAFADRNAAGFEYPSQEMAVASTDMPLVSYSTQTGVRRLVTFDPNKPDYVDLASKMLGI